MIVSQPTAYIINSNAIGDIVASLPVLKHLIETYHQDKKYKIIALPVFRDLFYFISDGKFFDVNSRIDFEEPYAQFKLNILAGDKIKTFVFPDGNEVQMDVIPQYVIPLRMHLTHYASIQLSNRVLPLEQMNYPKYPLDDNLIEYFDIDFSKCVAINPVFRSHTRKFLPEELKKLCDYIKEKGYTPLFLGNTETNYDDKDKIAQNIDFDFSTGIDLRNKTTIKEVINIIAKCKTIIGIDNGLIHLAAMTKIPIVAGYTMASPELRMPIRNNKLGYNIYPVLPDIECQGCQDKWQLDNHNFNECYFEHYDCTSKMSAEKFIAELEKILIS